MLACRLSAPQGSSPGRGPATPRVMQPGSGPEYDPVAAAMGRLEPHEMALDGSPHDHVGR